MERLPENWLSFLEGIDMLDGILEKVDAERAVHTVFPPEGKVFRAFELTAPEAVKVVLLGQDPYHDDGQAEGLAFSVPAGVKLPPSLRNIYKEFSADLRCPAPENGSLVPWAKSGVLLLNSVLTVRAHAPGSHRSLGWEAFTDAVISCLSRKRQGIVFLLLGAFAQAKKSLIDPEKHFVLENVHPSPLSAHRGFFGSSPFSQTEKLLNTSLWPRPLNDELFQEIFQ